MHSCTLTGHTEIESRPANLYAFCVAGTYFDLICHIKLRKKSLRSFWADFICAHAVLKSNSMGQQCVPCQKQKKKNLTNHGAGSFSCFAQTFTGDERAWLTYVNSKRILSVFVVFFSCPLRTPADWFGWFFQLLYKGKWTGVDVKSSNCELG